MTTKVLGIDLRDAGRDGVYRVDPDDPATLIDDAARAGLRLMRLDLRDYRDAPALLAGIAEAADMPAADLGSWPTLGRQLLALDEQAAGYVMLFDHASVLYKTHPDIYRALRNELAGVAAAWHRRGKPFFVFMEFPDNETRDAAIDA